MNTSVAFLFLLIVLTQCNSLTSKFESIGNKSEFIDSISKQDIILNPFDSSLQSQITCPKCGFKKLEIMPTEVCKIKYTCVKCEVEMLPKKGDCCVFCTYGTKKCPSMQ